jgi:hypothetical protein
MLGLDAAGKTTILYKLHIGEVLSTVPTLGAFEKGRGEVASERRQKLAQKFDLKLSLPHHRVGVGGMGGGWVGCAVQVADARGRRTRRRSR